MSAPRTVVFVTPASKLRTWRRRPAGGARPAGSSRSRVLASLCFVITAIKTTMPGKQSRVYASTQYTCCKMAHISTKAHNTPHPRARQQGLKQTCKVTLDPYDTRHEQALKSPAAGPHGMEKIRLESGAVRPPAAHLERGTFNCWR